MAISPLPPTLKDGDLHGLVDGLLDARRQAEVQQRLKSMPNEIAQVAAWREQNELLKATFSEIEHEPIPLSLRLLPPRLRCISEAYAAPTVLHSLMGPLPARRSGQRGLIASGILLGAVAVVIAALLLDHSPLRGPIPLTLDAGKASDGLLTTASFGSPQSTRADEASLSTPKHHPSLSDLPTSAIPDLGEAGFSFTDAGVRPSEPPVLVFSYHDRAGTLLSLKVSRAAEWSATDTHVERSEHTVSWHSAGRSYLMRAALEPQRLGAIAKFMQTAQDDSRR